MNETYRNAIVKMEEQDVDEEYILGWQGGFLGHPPREEQRTNEAYDAGYDENDDHDTEKQRKGILERDNHDTEKRMRKQSKAVQK